MTAFQLILTEYPNKNNPFKHILAMGGLSKAIGQVLASMVAKLMIPIPPQRTA